MRRQSSVLARQITSLSRFKLKLNKREKSGMKKISKTDFFLLTTDNFYGIIYKLYGSLVKRLRLRPLTPATRVRFPHESPEKRYTDCVSFFIIKYKKTPHKQCLCGVSISKLLIQRIFVAKSLNSCPTLVLRTLEVLYSHSDKLTYLNHIVLFKAA